MSIPAIAVHGGAGTILPSSLSPALEKKYHLHLQWALNEGFAILESGGTALDAVIKAVCTLEDCELFNAGRGSVFTAKGTHEMDAALMEGRELKAGAVAGIRGIKNPILLAHSILENTPHILLAGEEALEFAREKGFEIFSDAYFFTQERYDQWLDIKGSGKVQLDHTPDTDNKFGTVGAVAVDNEGTVAAATSTGGMTNKAWGRIGDTPIIGAGTYANNNTCAVSCTGHGEFFMKKVVAYDVSCLMEYKNMSMEQAADEAINHRLKTIGGEGGLIAVDARGNIAMPFNCAGMYRGQKNQSGSFTSIY